MPDTPPNKTQQLIDLIVEAFPDWTPVMAVLGHPDQLALPIYTAGDGGSFLVSSHVQLPFLVGNPDDRDYRNVRLSIHALRDEPVEVIATSLIEDLRKPDTITALYPRDSRPEPTHDPL